MIKWRPFLLRITLVLSVMSVCFHAVAQLRDTAVVSLTKHGFENITVKDEGDTLLVGFENRRYRFDPAGCAAMVKSLKLTVPYSVVVKAILLKQGIPVMEFYTGGKYPEVKVKTLPPRFRFRSAQRRISNSSLNKPELVIYPQVKMQLGNFDDPFKSQFNLAPALEMDIARGLHVMAQVIIPLQNDLEPHGNSLRPGIISISQFVRLPANVYSILSIGYFTRNRYGLNSEFRKYLANGKFFLGCMAGVTGYAEFYEKTWHYSAVDRFTWFLDAGFIWSEYDLTLQSGYGRFTDGSAGWRADIFRQFREVTIGFFALNADGFLNGGFIFRISIPPGRYITRHRFRVRPSSYFSYEYRARGLSDSGKFFYTGSSLADLFHNINPGFLQHHMIRLLK
jgi:hypothetical protein